MRFFKFIICFVFTLLLFSCDKDNEPNPIECNISYKISSTSVSQGDHLLITDFEVTPKLPTTGVNIQKVEFFLGNKKIASCVYPPYELDYEIPDLLEGEHLLQIDVHLTAEDFDDTTIWLQQNIKITTP